MELVQGARLAERFKVVGSLGTSLSGTSFLATDLRAADAPVILKVFNPERVRGADSIARVKRRIDQLRRVSHPNFAPGLEFIDDAELTGCVRPYIDGQDLQSQLASGPVSLPQIITVLKCLLSVVGSLHGAGVIHGDLKLSEVIVAQDGTLLLLPGSMLRVPGEALGLEVGSAQYKSPEQLRTGEADHRSDLYAIGMIGFELVERCPAVSADDRAILEVFLKRLTAVLPDQRPADAEMAIAELQSAFEALGKVSLGGAWVVALMVLAYVGVLIASLAGVAFLLIER